MSGVYRVNTGSNLVSVLNLVSFSKRHRAHGSQQLPTWGLQNFESFFKEILNHWSRQLLAVEIASGSAGIG